MRHLLCGIGLTLACTASDAADWILLAATDDVKWEGRSGSVEFSTNRGGVPIVSSSGRVHDLTSGRIEFERWYVTKGDCRKGYGKVVTTDMSGAYKFETDFVLDGGSVASSLAGVLCSAVAVMDAKGI